MLFTLDFARRFSRTAAQICDKRAPDKSGG